MNEQWNLDVIYGGFEDPAYQSDVKKFEQAVQAFQAFELSSGADRGKTLREGILLQDASLATEQVISDAQSITASGQKVIIQGDGG